MTGSGKTVWVQSLLQQAQNVIEPPPERIIRCYSQWQLAYSELLNTVPNIEFVKGIPENLEQDSYFDVHKRNLIVIDDQMIEAGNDNRIVNLFTKGSHHRNLSVIYIVQNLFHQGKGNRNISLNSHYLVLFKNPRDKLQILTLAKQMYPRQTDWFLRQYEEAVQRPFGYLFVDLKSTTQDNCRLRTNVLPNEEKFDKGGVEANISQELLQYLKQQNVMIPPVIPEMQRLQNNMDKLLYRTDLGEYDKAKHYTQLQNKYLTFKQQLNSRPRELNPRYSEEQREISSNILPGHVPPLIQESVTVQAVVETPTTIQVTTAKQPMAAQATPAEASLLSSILTPPPTVELMSPPKKRKRPRIPQLKNYLDDDAQKTYGPFRRTRRNRKESPYKYPGAEDY